MNTNEVVEMIDAITEGREFSTSWEPMAGENLHILTRDDSFVISFSSVPNIVSLDNPQTAREIAGALVAWANRKEGKFNQSGQDAQHAIEGGLGLYLTNQAVKPDENEGRTGVWHEEWYHRNVKRMTRETVERNLKDLRGIYNTLRPDSAEAIDIQKAMNILHDTLMGIPPTPSKENDV